MPLELPVIDDRNFEDLLAEAKRRIPAHTPEWTNFEGESDPGITVVELFAFLTEVLLYRAGRIPERNRVKFLQLLGIGLQKAAPARGLVTITNVRAPLAPLTLPAGLVMQAGGVPFLTRDAVTVLPVEGRAYYKNPISPDDPRHAEYAVRYAALAAARAAAAEDGAGETPVDLAFYESLPMTLPTPADPAPALEIAATLDRALYVALLAPPNADLEAVRAAIAGKTLSLMVVPALGDGAPPLLPRRALPDAQAPGPDLTYEIADPASPDGSPRYAPLRPVSRPDVLRDPGVVMLALPNAPAALRPFAFTEPLQEGSGDFPPRLEDEEAVQRLVTWLRLRVTSPQGGTGTVSVRLTHVALNAVRVEQAIPVTEETLGTGTGEPDQVYFLANTPVLEDSVRLTVGGSLWRRTDDLLAAESDEGVFTLDPESGEVRFGDGLRGARPPLGVFVRASYEYGGGTQGNVGIGAVKASPNPSLQSGFRIENPLPTYGGDTAETPEEGERQIPLTLRHRDRLVTAQDFTDVTRRTPGVDVGRVDVLPLFLPGPPVNAAAPGVVTVMVVPAFDAANPLWPTPDRLFLRTVCEHLDARRLMTTEIHVRGPIYLPVHVSVGVRVRGGHFRDEVFQSVRERLRFYLSALPPGGVERTGWPRNKRLLARDLEAVVTRVPGVEYVESLEMGVGSATPRETYDLSGLELPRLDRLGVVEGPAEPLATLLGDQPSGGTPGGTVVPVPVSRTRC